MTELNGIVEKQLYSLLQSFAEERKWHLKYAKFNWRSHQSLLTHSLNVASISLALLEFLESKQLAKQNNQTHLQLFLTGFLHDCGKESDVYQNAVKQFLIKNGPKPLDFGHQQETSIRPVTEALEKYINGKVKINEDTLEQVIWSITQLGKRENAASISQTFKKAPSREALLCSEIVHFCDILAAKHSVDEVASISIEGTFLSELSLHYSKVSEVRGVLTHFLHIVLEKEIEAQGFKALLWFPDGTIYVGLKNNITPVIERTKITELLSEKMKQTLSQSYARDMARAAFGSLPQRVICAPEFLFASDETVHSFWKFILSQRFSKPNVKVKENLTESEVKLLKALSSQLQSDNDESKLVLLARFIADFNLLIVLYAARKELIDNVPKNKKALSLDAIDKAFAIFAEHLCFPEESLRNWPEIALQTKTEKRAPVITSLWKSPYYTNALIWRTKLAEALAKSTIEFSKIWRANVPDQFKKVANMLVNDIAIPTEPSTIIEKAKEMGEITAKGKTNHGTIFCQKCGGAAITEAQASLFGSSEIYHDNLVAGARIGGGNKLMVCTLCEFEEKLRRMLTGGNVGYTGCFYILPQVSLSRRQQFQWQTTINKIEYNPGTAPPLLRLNQWAKGLLSGQELFTSNAVNYSYLSENDLLKAINDIAEQQNLEDDLSPMIDPPLDAKSSKEVLSLLKEGKTKLAECYQQEVDRSLSQIEPVYISPNFILLLTRRTVASNKDEPVSVTEIKWVFLRLLLARLFHANVQSEVSRNLGHLSLGYTKIPANLNLRPLSEKLNAKNGWIDIPDIEKSIRKLSALILIDNELSALGKGYGKATLLRLLNEEPGRVLNRAITRNKGVFPKKLINNLDVWYYQ